MTVAYIRKNRLISVITENDRAELMDDLRRFHRIYEEYNLDNLLNDMGIEVQNGEENTEEEGTELFGWGGD